MQVCACMQLAASYSAEDAPSATRDSPRVALTSLEMLMLLPCCCIAAILNMWYCATCEVLFTALCN